MSRDGSVSKVTDYKPDDRSAIPRRDKLLSPHPHCFKTSSEANAVSFPTSIDIFCETKQTEQEANNSTSFITELKNAWSYIFPSSQLWLCP
jgi:hypothetical protein